MAMADFDNTFQEELVGLSRDGNVTDIIKPRKSILKVRENTTLPISTGVSLDGRYNRRVSFAEKVKLHKIEFVSTNELSSDDSESENGESDGVNDSENGENGENGGHNGSENGGKNNRDMAINASIRDGHVEWPEPLSSSDDDLSFSNLEADADKVLTALGSSLSDKILGSLELSGANFYRDSGALGYEEFKALRDHKQGADAMGLASEDENTMELTEQVSGPRVHADPKPEENAMQVFNPDDINSHNDNMHDINYDINLHAIDPHEADLEEEDMEFTGQVATDFKQAVKAHYGPEHFAHSANDLEDKNVTSQDFNESKEDTMELTEYQSGEFQSHINEPNEETMDFTQLGESVSASENVSGNSHEEPPNQIKKRDSTGDSPIQEFAGEQNAPGPINLSVENPIETAENPTEDGKQTDLATGPTVPDTSAEFAEKSIESSANAPNDSAAEKSSKASANTPNGTTGSAENIERSSGEAPQFNDLAGEKGDITKSGNKDSMSEDQIPVHDSAPVNLPTPSNNENNLDEDVTMELTQPTDKRAMAAMTPTTESELLQLTEHIETFDYTPVVEQNPARSIHGNLESIPEQSEESTGEINQETPRRVDREAVDGSSHNKDENPSSSSEEAQKVKSPKRTSEDALQTSPKRHSSYVTEVKTTTIPLAGNWNDANEDDFPVLSLEDFLQEIGIKFYDDLEIATDLSSQYRFAAHSQEQFGPNDYYRANIQIPLLEVYELSCKELAGKIQQGKLLFEELQQKTLQDNPDLFRQYQKATFYERVAMKSQFHLMRELTRQQAKQVWYEWRTKLFKNIIEVFQTNLNIVQDDRRILSSNMEILEENMRETRHKIHALQADMARFKAMKENFKTLETEHIHSIKARMTELNEKLSRHRDMILARKQSIGAVEARIKEINDQLLAVEKECASAQADLNNTKHLDHVEIAGLQTEAKIVQACAGLKYVGSASDEVYEFEFNPKMSIIIDASRPESTDGLLFRPKHSRDAVLFNEALMDRYCQSLAEKTPFSNIYDTLRAFKRKWTKLLQLDEDLHKLSLKGPLRIDTSDLACIVFNVDVYVYAKSLKVTLSGSVDVDELSRYPESVVWSAQVHRHGDMSPSEVKRIICEWPSLAGFPSLRAMKME